MYHVPLAAQCIYGWSDEVGQDRDGKEGSELDRGWERVEIGWPLVCSRLGSMWGVRGGPESDGGTVC